MAFEDELLATARQEVAQAPMLDLSIVNARFINISNEIGAGVKAHTFKQATRYGVAQVITTRATAVPLVEDSMEEFLVRVFPIRLGFELEQDDLELAQATGQNIATPKMSTTKEGIEREIDIIGFEGKPNTTLKGIANHDNVSVIDFPADGNENGGTNSVQWQHKTPLQILRDLNIISLAILEQTANTVSANRLLLPMSKVNYLSTTPFNPSTGESILSVYLKNQVNMPNGGITDVIGHPALETAGTSGVGRIAAYNTTSRFNKFHIPRGGDFRDLPPERQASTIKVACQMKTAGMEIERIKEVVYANVR